MKRIRIVTDSSKHVGCGGLMAMSQDAPEYILEHEGVETTIPGAEMICVLCGERIRSQDEVETPDNRFPAGRPHLYLCGCRRELPTSDL